MRRKWPVFERNQIFVLDPRRRRISKLLETVADAALRRPRAVQARHEPRSGPVKPGWTRAGLSQRDNLYQQLRDAPPA